MEGFKAEGIVANFNILLISFSQQALALLETTI